VKYSHIGYVKRRLRLTGIKTCHLSCRNPHSTELVPSATTAVTPISLGTFSGQEIGKYSAADLSDFEFVLCLDCAGIFANPCNPWEIRVSGQIIRDGSTVRDVGTSYL